MARRRIRTALLFALCGLALLFMPLVAGNASVVPGAVTGVKVEQTTVGKYQAVIVDIKFAIPAGAKTGDTFSVKLPASLNSQNQTFPVLAPDGSVVANAVVKNGVVTFTLTDYVEKFDHVVGSAKLQGHFNQGLIHPGGNDLAFTSGGKTFHNPVTITSATGPRTGPRKIGFWTNPEDQGSTDATDAVAWRVQSWAGPLTNLKIVDTLGPSQVNDCRTAKFSIVSSTTVRSDGSLKNPQPLGNRAVLVCNPTSFVVTVASVNPGEVVEVDYFTTITDQSSKTFTNQVALTAKGHSKSVGWKLAHYEATGVGVGVTPPTTPTTPSTTPTTAPPTTQFSVEATSLVRTPSTTSAAVSSTTAAATLPFTGSRTTDMSEAGGLLLLIGSGLLFLGRRRRGVHQN